MVSYLDLDRKVWKIGNLEIPVIEDVPMKETKWFNKALTEKQRIIDEAEKDETKEGLSDADIAAFEQEWFSKVANLAFGKTVEDIEESGITLPQFREVMAEAFLFLTVHGSIEKAKQSDMYLQKTQDKEKKQ